MKYKYFLVLTIVLCVAVSLISLGKIKNKNAKPDAVSVINGNSVKSDGKAIDESSSAVSIEITSIQRAGTQETKTLADGSEISTTYNRFGNKTETRTFNSHPRLSYVILNTSTEGNRQVYVYAQNGVVKTLPESMLDRIATASADEIANSAGIPMIMRQSAPQPDFVLNNSLPSAAPVQPRQYNPPPIQTESNEAVTAEENTEAKTTADNVEKKVPSADNVEKKAPSAGEAITLNRQPEKE